MPWYTYTCEKCGHQQDELRKVDSRDQIASCEACKSPAPRDFKESMSGLASTDKEYHTPVYSDSLGVHPNQVAEAKRRFPHHEYAPDGRMVIRSHNQYKKIRKELGFHDRAGYG